MSLFQFLVEISCIMDVFVDMNMDYVWKRLRKINCIL